MKSQRIQLPRIMLVSVLACISLTGCGAEEEKLGSWPQLRIGYLPIAAELPLFVAVEEGFLADEGLDFELVQLPSSNELVNTATAGRVDILAGAAANVIFDSGQASGKKHLLFAINPYSDRPGHITDRLLVDPKSQSRSVPDLKGGRIASFPGSVVVLVHLTLADYGLQQGEYESIQMLPKDWQPSLESGAVDAVVALEPSATQMMHDGAGRSILDGFYAKLMQDMPLSGHWFGADFLERADQKQLEAVLRAYDRAISFCNEEPEVARRYLSQYANVRPDIVEAVNLNPWVMVSAGSVDTLQQFADVLAENDAILSHPDASEYVYSNFLD